MINLNKPTLVLSNTTETHALVALLPGYNVVDLEDSHFPNDFQGAETILWPSGGDACRHAMDEFAALIKPHAKNIKMVITLGVSDGVGPSMHVANGFDASGLLAYMKPKLELWRPMPKQVELQPQADYSVVGEYDQMMAQVSGGQASGGNVTQFPVEKTRAPRKKNAPVQSESAVLSWQTAGLQSDMQGRPYTNIDNVYRTLSKLPDSLGGKLLYLDSFSQRVIYGDRVWVDSDDLRLTMYMQRHMDMPKMSVGTVHDGVLTYASNNVRDGLQDYLNGLTWDGTNRLNTFLQDAFGVCQTPYIEAVGRCWLMQMVDRGLHPGCQADYMPVLEGLQGQRKDTALRVLGGEWHADIQDMIGSKDFLQSIQGKWLCVISDLHGFKRADMKLINALITTRNDHYRSSYGRFAENHPRRCVFAGTTNEDQYHRDPNGARRLWPIRVREVNLDYLGSQRDQLFAEALVMLKTGRLTYDVPGAEAKEEQRQRYVEDSIIDQIHDYCTGRKEFGCTLDEIMAMALQLPEGQRDQRMQSRIQEALRHLGWRSVAANRGGRSTKVWLPTAD